MDEPLPQIRRGHPRLALATALGLAAPPVPAFVFLASESRWQPQDLFTILLAIGFVSYSAAAHIRRTASLDIGFVAALLGLVLLGPLPAVLIVSASELGPWLAGKQPVRVLSNVSSAEWGVLSGAVALDAAGLSLPVHEPQALGQYVIIGAAGLLLVTVDYLVVTPVSTVVVERARIELVAEAGRPHTRAVCGRPTTKTGEDSQPLKRCRVCRRHH